MCLAYLAIAIARWYVKLQRSLRIARSTCSADLSSLLEWLSCNIPAVRGAAQDRERGGERELERIFFFNSFSLTTCTLQIKRKRLRVLRMACTLAFLFLLIQKRRRLAIKVSAMKSFSIGIFILNCTQGVHPKM